MKKNYALLGILSVGALLGFAQNGITPSLDINHEKKIFTNQFDVVDENDFIKNPLNDKAFGDTLYYQDFAGGLPAGWSVVNNNANNFLWQWSNVAQNGQFTGGFNAIQSTTAANGFMSLPSDFYNSPTPITGAVSMDTYFQSDTITIAPTNAVWVSYQQWLLYCCLDATLTGSVRLLLQVSTDNFATFTDFLANDNLTSNSIAVGNAVAVTNNVINISPALNGATSFQVRFLAEGNDAYFWYIDDFAVVEGAQNDIQLTNEFLEFYTDNHAFNPFYGQIPYALFPPLPFSANLRNNGSNTATKSRIEVDVTHTSLPGGAGGGSGLLYSTASADTTLPFDSSLLVLTQSPRFIPQILGNFTVDFTAEMDSLDEVPVDNTAALSFATSSTIFAVDDGGFGGGTGSGSYVRNGAAGGTAVGDRFLTKYIFEPNRTLTATQRKPTSITFAVSDDVSNIGVEILPIIYEFFEDSLFSATVTSLDQAVSGSAVATSFIPYTVQPGDTNGFITLDLDNGPAFINGLDSGAQYLVGFEVTSIAGGTNFEVQNDFTSSLLQPGFQTFLWFGHAAGWGTTGDNPVMRLNLDSLPLPTSISNSMVNDATFSISPNPNNGQFNLNVSTEVATSYNVNIRNVVGQIVYQDVISVNGIYNEQIDLSTFEKGMYFVSLENDSEKHLKKVVVK